VPFGSVVTNVRAQLTPIARPEGRDLSRWGAAQRPLCNEKKHQATLAAIRRRSTVREDQLAVPMPRQAGILFMLGHIVRFEEERAADALRATRQIIGNRCGDITEIDVDVQRSLRRWGIQISRICGITSGMS
jgi:hypothetical protein